MTNNVCLYFCSLHPISFKIIKYLAQCFCEWSPCVSLCRDHMVFMMT